MPPSAVDTRRKLIEAATRSFAKHGVFDASLIEITRQAGQRNRGALHYHFGSRTGVLVALMEPHADFLAAREGALLAIAVARPDEDVRSVVEAIVRPVVELAESGWQGRCFLVILAELIEQDPDATEPEIQAVLHQTGGYEVYALLAQRMVDVNDDVRDERLALVTSFILRSVADRARAQDRKGRSHRHQLDTDAFVENLIAMVTAMVSAPAPAPAAG